MLNAGACASVLPSPDGQPSTASCLGEGTVGGNFGLLFFIISYKS